MNRKSMFYWGCLVWKIRWKSDSVAYLWYATHNLFRGGAL